MDAARLLYLENVPSVSDKQLEKTFRPLGLEKVVRLSPPYEGSVFAQFGSAAKIKAALEVLQAAGITATVSENTSQWVSRTAKNASVQSVIRMQPAQLVTRIAAALERDREPTPQPDQNQNPSNRDDVALNTGDVDEDENVSIQREIAQFHAQARDAEIERRAKSQAVLEKLKTQVEQARSTQSPQKPPQKSWAKFVEARTQWQQERQAQLKNSEISRQNTAEKNYAKAMAGDGLGTPQPNRDSERQADESLFPLQTVASLVTEYFGDADDDVIAFVNEHIEKHGTADELTTEFAEILGAEESQQFAEKIMRL